MAESREKIKGRMLRNVSKMWGYSENEAETSFDPLVGMLLTACASELVNISQEINESQTRVTEKLIELLSPDTISGVIPAHAIASGRPLEPTFLLKPDYQFFFNKKVRDTKKNQGAQGKDIFFSSSQPVTLVDGSVRYMAFGSTLYETDADYHKEAILRSGSSKLPQSTLYLGIELNERIKNLEALSFYFDLRNPGEKKLFYYNLRNSDWHLGDAPLEVYPGYGTDHRAHNSSSELSTGFDKVINRYAEALRHINNYYRDNFITIRVGKAVLDRYRKDQAGGQSYPEQFATLFEAEELEEARLRDVLWLRVEFSSVVNEKMLSDVFCSINTFPVINKRFQTSIFKLRKYLNIIPLLTDDFFLDIEKVQDGSGMNFTRKSFDSISYLKSGELLIRTEGMGRFDSRSASQFLAQLLELLRDESASFSIFGKDALSREIKNLNQLISRLEQRVDSVKTPHNVTYLLLKSHEEQDTLFLDFHTTNGAEANDIRAGSLMKPFVGSEMKGGIKLLTSTIGGRDGLDYEGRINAYRSALLSRNKVVTREDVRVRCLHHFGNRISDVTIEKGYTESLSLKGGFVRTMDLHLRPASTAVPENEWQQLCRDLSVTLQEESVNIFPFRFFIDDKMVIID